MSDLDSAADAARDPWGPSVAEQPPRLRYTRWHDRVLAIIWPPRRRRLRAYNRFAAKALAEVQREHNEALRQVMLYGTAAVRLSWLAARDGEAE